MKVLKKSLALLLSAIMTVTAALSIPALNLTVFAEGEESQGQEVSFYNQGEFSNGASAAGWTEAQYTCATDPEFTVTGLQSQYNPSVNQRINLTAGTYTNWDAYKNTASINFEVLNNTSSEIACARLFKGYGNYTEIQLPIESWKTKTLQTVSVPLADFAKAGFDLTYVGGIGMDHGTDKQGSSFYVTRIYLSIPAAEVKITKDLADAEATVGGDDVVLSVGATTTGTAPLEYKWYSCDDAEGTNPVEITGATTKDLTVSAEAKGTFYRYVVVSASDADTPVTSKVAKVTVKEAEKTVDFFANGSFATGASNAGFDAVETYDDISCLKSQYQQNEMQRVKFTPYANLSGYSDGVVKVTLFNSTGSTEGAIRFFSDDTTYVECPVTLTAWQSHTLQTVSVSLADAEAAGANLKGVAGIGFYVKNGGNTRIYVASVQLAYNEEPAPTQYISITKQPVNASAEVGDVVKEEVNAVAVGVEGATLNYAWYSCDDAEGTNPVLVSGATTNELTVPTANAGTYYYFAEVSAEGLASVNSNVVTVEVKLPQQTMSFFNDGVFGENASNGGFDAVETYEGRGCLKTQYTQTANQRVKFSPWKDLSFYEGDGTFNVEFYNTTGSTEGEIRIFSDDTTYVAIPVTFTAWQKKTAQTASVSLADVVAAGANLKSVAGIGFYVNGEVKDRIYIPSVTMTYFQVPPVTECTVTFKANGGTGTMKDQVVTAGEETALTKNAFTKKGYKFNGWVDQNGKSYKDGALITTEEDLTLTAQWAKVTYTITYKLDGGKNSSKNPAKYYVTSKDITLANATKTGYTFAGWYTSSSFKTKITTIKGSACKNYTLYAKFTANKYTIKFNANGGKGTMKSLAATYNKNVTLTKNKFTKKGYKFKGWATSKTNAKKGKVKYKNAQKVKNLTTKAKGTVTLYAVWKK